jgi:hypothetical protein
MSELLEAAGSLAAIAALVLLIGIAAYWAFGPVAVGLPSIVGVLAVFGLVSLASDLGLGAGAALLVLAGVLALLLVIGMAMRLGADPPRRSRRE